MNYSNSDIYNERVEVEDKVYSSGTGPTRSQRRLKDLTISEERWFENFLSSEEDWNRKFEPGRNSKIRFEGQAGSAIYNNRNNHIFYELEDEVQGLEANAVLFLAPELSRFYSEQSSGLSFQVDKPSEIEEVTEILTDLDKILGSSYGHE